MRSHWIAGLTQDSAFDQWANQVSNLSAGGVAAANFRKDIRIEPLNEAGQIVLAYKVYRCWVSQYQVLPDLDAGETPWRSSRFASRTRAGSATPASAPPEPLIGFQGDAGLIRPGPQRTSLRSRPCAR